MVFEENKMQYIIIAGPQAAGKTTTKKYFEKKYNDSENKNIIFLDETREIVNKKYNPFGTLTVTRDLEYKIIEEDLTRLNKISEREKEGNMIYVDETSLFGLAHSSLRGIEIKDYLKEYINILKGLNPKIFFIDVNPEVSWSRRKDRYENRLGEMSYLEKNDALGEIRGYLDNVYPQLIQMFWQIDLPKMKIDGVNNVRRQN